MLTYFLIATALVAIVLVAIYIKKRRDKYKEEMEYIKFLQEQLNLFQHILNGRSDKDSKTCKGLKREINKIYMELIS
ncbi:hypothetical protein OFO01_07605 [Campylobacter sp. JMF_01 NE2]|uniref:hypothetical protein n=1 Tax=unclassified Campylobacter TaxID=2593542 RepID=UPI0022EA08B0|nr:MULTISPECIES: hypothetical protein [unclassified Campylobacter]MDA3053332.1 hypothetical protein [Campylobacter sp. JMF_03 NE3]MDA3067648.1 hypothetical protein [Campylobacter sp. JMF_01 NE2]